ncbi:polysaccharide deacetylase family protein, partial [Pseudomonas sp. TNT11]|nr:polysaccharide deacetylase family protein [Pseudomonas emilianonis]
MVAVGRIAGILDRTGNDRGVWPEELSSPALFDVASRAEILMFAHSLIASEALDEAALK